jgi:GNAT superfamily N-acetyltransferase
MPQETEARVLEILEHGLAPTSFDAILELFERFEQAHPHERHAYLGILGTHPDFRGLGIAQQLVAENLRRLDEEATPVYLESTNPGNDHRYERLGFEKVGGFAAVLDGAPVTTMWRAAR